MTILDTSLELILTEDDEPEIKCGYRRAPGCDAKAAWFGITGCCGASEMFCEFHKENEVQWFESTPIPVCKICKHKIPSIRWERL